MSIKEILLFDLKINDDIRKKYASDKRIKIVEGDLRDTLLMKNVLSPNGSGWITCFHMAAVMSGPSEKNFDLGLSVNLKAPMDILEIIRNVSKTLKRPQTYVFTSTDYVTCLNDYNRDNPCNEESFRLSAVSYGVQKACVELLASDYSRKGFIDARVLRLCCVVVKPGIFDVLSYPYHGVVSQTIGSKDKVFECPLKKEQRFACTFIANCVDCLEQLGGSIDGGKIGVNRVVQAPAYSFSLQEIWEAVLKVCDDKGIPVGKIKWIPPSESKQTVKEINVCPFVTFDKAKKLGLPYKFTLTDVVKDFLENHPIQEIESRQ
mmetsp:Transcript_22421/g.33431  ORF Transcript_22421/g.33431 Transcript_22421/m.33431 type:complete len:319 (+) Transcript_22421:67-1023(+)